MHGTLFYDIVLVKQFIKKCSCKIHCAIVPAKNWPAALHYFYYEDFNNISPLTNNIMIYVVWWSCFCLSSTQNAFYRCPSNQSKVQQAALHLKNCSTLSENIFGASDFFSLLTHSEHRTSSLRSEWDCSPNELVQHINLLALLNACSVTRARNVTKIPGALLVLNSLKESLKFLSACCSLTSFMKNFKICIWKLLCVLGLAKLVRIFSW